MRTPEVRPSTHNQSGLVSIMVTIIMLLVVTLIVLGFSQISRVEQRQSLDRQLSTQAFLAAESGVNDARKAIEAAAATGTIPDKTQCTNTGAPAVYTTNLAPVLDGPNNISYTCLLIDTTLPDIVQNVPVDSPVTIPINAAPTDVIREIRLNLRVPSPASVTGCSGSVPAPLRAYNAWPGGCSYGALRVDMVPTNTLSRVALTANQQSFVFYPVNGAAPAVNFANAAANRGSVFPMRCTTTDCTVSINVPGGAGTTYAMRVASVYRPGELQIRAFSPSGAPLTLRNAQVMVDATGKAQDVLRRIQVRFSLVQSSENPGRAVVSGSSICKRFAVSTTVFNVDSGISGQDADNPMCRP